MDIEEEPSPEPYVYEPVTKHNWYQHRDRLRGTAQIIDDDPERIEVQEEDDDFEDFECTGWRLACKDILYLLYYDEDAGPFLDPLTREALGYTFDEYVQTIKNPICLLDVKETLFRGKDYMGPERTYLSADEFVRDMELVFKNAIKFNEKGSDFYKQAKTMLRLLRVKLDELSA